MYEDLEGRDCKGRACFEALGVKNIAIKNQDFRRVQLHRNNAFYGFLLHVELVHMELFPKQTGSASSFASLLKDERRMSWIFERFVRNFFRQEPNELRVSSERIYWDISGDGRGKPAPSRMETDVSLRSAARTVIIDAKYYAKTLQTHREKERVRSAHLYQVLREQLLSVERDSIFGVRAVLRLQGFGAEGSEPCNFILDFLRAEQ